MNLKQNHKTVGQDFFFIHQELIALWKMFSELYDGHG